MRQPLLAAVLLLAATPGAAQRDRIPDATPSGDPVDCVRLSDIRETRVRSDRVIDFYLNGRRVYRNTLPQSCPELGFEQRFAYKTSLSQLCSVDIITVLHGGPPMTGASCGLGRFQPVQLTPAAR